MAKSIKKEGYYLISLLASVMNDVDPPIPPEAIDWNFFYKLSKFHRVSSMTHNGILRLAEGDRPPQEILKNLRLDYKRSLAKETVLDYHIEQLLDTFENNEIACIPLKGHILKKLYPSLEMRDMGDVDILFYDNQSDAVKFQMTNMGYELVNEGGNHDVYIKEPYVAVEMHRRLFSKVSPYSSYYNNVWDKAIPENDRNHIYGLSIEDTFVYIMVHLIKHYANSGTGIRSIMDIWIYMKHYEGIIDWEYVNKEFDKLKISRIAENICNLSRVWFDNEETNEVYEIMTEYIVSSGTYGTIKYYDINKLSKQGTSSIIKSKVKIIFSLFFPRLETMSILYPLLDKHRLMLPIFWLLRGMKAVLFKNKYTIRMLKKIMFVSRNELSDMNNLRKRSGINK